MKIRIAEGENSVRGTNMFLKMPFGSSQKITNSSNKSADCSLLLIGLLSISATPNEKLN